MLCFTAILLCGSVRKLLKQHWNGTLGPALSAGVFITAPPFIYSKNVPEPMSVLFKGHRAMFCHGQNMSSLEIMWS